MLGGGEKSCWTVGIVFIYAANLETIHSSFGGIRILVIGDLFPVILLGELHFLFPGGD